MRHSDQTVTSIEKVPTIPPTGSLRTSEPRFVADLAYWQQQLIPNPPLLELPGDGIRTGRTVSAAASAVEASRLELDRDLRSRLIQWCDQSGISVEHTLLASFYILLHRYTDETCLLLHLARSSQLCKGSMPQSRLNPLLLRVDLHRHQTALEVCHLVRTNLLEATAHDGIDYQTLMEQIHPDRNLLVNPLSLIQFGMLKEPELNEIQSKRQNKIPSESSDLNPVVFPHDIEISIRLADEHWAAEILSRSDLFSPATLNRMMGHLEQILNGLMDNGEQPISQMLLLSDEERHDLLVHWNQTRSQAVPDRCMHEYIEQQVECNPNAIAVVYPHADGHVQTLTYAELNQRANQLAHYLRSIGFQPDNPVPSPIIGVCMDRSPEMIIAFLGILKAGAAYLPLDPLYPHERRVYKLQDCKTALLLTQEHLAATVAPDDFHGAILCLDRDWSKIATFPTSNLINLSTPETLAYVIYTSGSTGNPKGVMIPHRGLTNHCFAMRDAFELKQHDRMLQFSSMSFDIIIEELYPTLVTGAALVLRTDIIARSIAQFMTFIDQHQISILDLPTAFWHELVHGMGKLQLALPRSVRLVVVGGEKASKNLYQQWCQLVAEHPHPVRWLNTYGPTETTVSATLYEPATDGFCDRMPEIPIGRPLPNVQAYVLDRHLNPVPVNVPGTLYIGGVGVGLGYLNRIEQTEEKFITNPFSQCPSDRIYNTGDIVRYLADGTIEFVGRKDFQVKIRGFRIELGEIERVMESHPQIQQAVVLAWEMPSGEKRLAAYYILRKIITDHPIAEDLLPLSDLRSFLRSALPDYMIPVFLMPMPVLPLTPNGKVDRKALPDPTKVTPTSTDVASGSVAPQDTIEEQLVTLWQTVLGIPTIGVTDNFFELGGHSLLIVQLLVQIEAEWQRTLPINILFEAPTIRQLAAFLRSPSESATPDRKKLVAFRESGSDSPIFCVPGARCSLVFAHGLAKALENRFLEHPSLGDRPVYGFQEPLKSDGVPLPTSIPEIAAYYIQAMQEIQPQGPYYLVGYSIGGLIAYEMAQQLRDRGQQIALLGLLDPTPPHGWIAARSALKQIPVSHRLALITQLSILKILTVLDFSQLHLREVPMINQLGYLWDAFQGWARSEEGRDFWERFRRMLGMKALPSDDQRYPEQLGYHMVMKYERAVLYYLPKSYEEPVKVFFSQQWRSDVANWRAWERFIQGNVERYYFPGEHTGFYHGNNMVKMVQYLFPE